MLLAASSSGSTTVSEDRGVIHQLLVDMGVSSSTAHTVQVYTIGPLRILLILLLAVVLSHLVGRISRRLVASLRLVSPLVRTTPRGEERATTLAGVFASVSRAVIWIVAIVTILGELQINLLPFVATATVIGAAVGFGAQSLVKDFLSGFLIVAEDQYAVGDSIVVGTGPTATTGTVEGVTLRTTRVRGLDGVIWYVPNGDIRTVGNNTESDSQALVDVLVPHGVDLVLAGKTAETAARDLAGEPAWKGIFIGEPTFVGVQSTDENGATLRVMARTTPGQHFQAARQLRLRVLQQLWEKGVAWAQPASSNGASAPTPADDGDHTGPATSATGPTGPTASDPSNAAADTLPTTATTASDPTTATAPEPTTATAADPSNAAVDTPPTTATDPTGPTPPTDPGRPGPRPQGTGPRSRFRRRRQS
jgi:moderate conductance mechanosensitive channel